MGLRTIRRCPITLCGKQKVLSRGLISRATDGDRIRCLGRLKPASFAEYRALPIWRSMKQYRITCAGSLGGRRGKMGQSTTYAEVMKHVTPDHFMASITRYIAIGST